MLSLRRNRLNIINFFFSIPSKLHFLCTQQLQHILSTHREFNFCRNSSEYVTISNSDDTFSLLISASIILTPKPLAYKYMLALRFEFICTFCQYRILLPHLCQHTIVGHQFFVFPAPRICSSVIRIFISLHARFITVIQAWNSRQHILYQRQDFHPVFCKPHLIVRDAIVLLIFFAESSAFAAAFFVSDSRCITEDSQRPRSVMTSHQVQSTVKILRRIVFCQTVQSSYCSKSIASAQHIIHQKVTDRIIHSTVQLIAHEISSLYIVAYLIAGIFPDFSHQESIRINSLNSLPDACNEIIGKLIGHIKSPSGNTCFQPLCHYIVMRLTVAYCITVAHNIFRISAIYELTI